MGRQAPTPMQSGRSRPKNAFSARIHNAHIRKQHIRRHCHRRGPGRPDLRQTPCRRRPPGAGAGAARSVGRACDLVQAWRPYLRRVPARFPLRHGQNLQKILGQDHPERHCPVEADCLRQSAVFARNHLQQGRFHPHPAGAFRCGGEHGARFFRLHRGHELLR